jgi:hypothetical protein
VELIFQDMLIVDMESTHSSTFHFFTAVDIYAGVAASLAERKKGGQLTEFLKNIRGTIDDDEWDQVLGAAINVYANKHKERPDRLIDMLLSNHRYQLFTT